MRGRTNRINRKERRERKENGGLFLALIVILAVRFPVCRQGVHGKVRRYRNALDDAASAFGQQIGKAGRDALEIVAAGERYAVTSCLNAPWSSVSTSINCSAILFSSSR